MRHALRLALFIGVAVLPIAACHAGGSAPFSNANATENEAESGLATETLSIATMKGERRFTVEIAQTAEEQSRGLMFRTKLAPDRGMIFPMLPPRDVAFWMKNTLIPLDMIFIRPNRTIARIEANTVPETLDPVSSNEPVIAVLEIAGGQAVAQGIAPGDLVTLPF
ncbi:DUF192 domain-containing protein [Aquisediminimonas sediminicola]|uniref:DUF192 domain-containing protein n=1 Tax=Alteraquisediminimonas sediminicola TaxID=2676787 RepID=UPI001C8E8520|nr:DUF192 domain-containing protein [Aquisediminimonas sediminicola]